MNPGTECTEAIALVYNVADKIYQQVQTAKTNKAQCVRLRERVKIIVAAIKDLEKISDKSRYQIGLTTYAIASRRV